MSGLSDNTDVLVVLDKLSGLIYHRTYLIKSWIGSVDGIVIEGSEEDIAEIKEIRYLLSGYLRLKSTVVSVQLGRLTTLVDSTFKYFGKDGKPSLNSRYVIDYLRTVNTLVCGLLIQTTNPEEQTLLQEISCKINVTLKRMERYLECMITVMNMEMVMLHIDQTLKSNNTSPEVIRVLNGIHSLIKGNAMLKGFDDDTIVVGETPLTEFFVFLQNVIKGLIEDSDNLVNHFLRMKV